MNGNAATCPYCGAPLAEGHACDAARDAAVAIRSELRPFSAESELFVFIPRGQSVTCVACDATFRSDRKTCPACGEGTALIRTGIHSPGLGLLVATVETVLAEQRW